MITGKIILITGGAGSIGSNLTRSLCASNNVIVVDDLSSGHRRNLDNIENMLFLEGHILEEEILDKAFGNKPDIVFHLAALFANQNSVDHPERDLMINGNGILRVLQKSVLHNVDRFVYTSSACVYGNQETIMSENRIGSLDTPYAITKLLGEQYCRYFFENYGLKVNSLRLFNAFGPGEMPGKYRNVVPNFLWLAMNGKPLPIAGDGLQTRSFTYVEDTVDAIIRSAVKDKAINEIINVGSNVETSIIELAELINEITGNNSGIEYKSRPNWDSVLRRHPNLKKAKSLLGWAPTTNLRHGIERLYPWLEVAMRRKPIE